MALQSTFQAVRPVQHSWFESITEISILGSTLIEGLGAFGLAASGVSPTLYTETEPLQSQSLPRTGNGPTQ
jgi:hypothetical protein